ncbi:hypothetical protein ACJ41O_009897 [Fusarium nematophilum]
MAYEGGYGGQQRSYGGPAPQRHAPRQHGGAPPQQYGAPQQYDDYQGGNGTKITTMGEGRHRRKISMDPDLDAGDARCPADVEGQSLVHRLPIRIEVAHILPEGGWARDQEDRRQTDRPDEAVCVLVRMAQTRIQQLANCRQTPLPSVPETPILATHTLRSKEKGDGQI